MMSEIVFPLVEILDCVCSQADADERSCPEDDVKDAEIGEVTLTDISGAELNMKLESTQRRSTSSNIFSCFFLYVDNSQRRQ